MESFVGKLDRDRRYRDLAASLKQVKFDGSMDLEGLVRRIWEVKLRSTVEDIQDNTTLKTAIEDKLAKVGWDATEYKFTGTPTLQQFTDAFLEDPTDTFMQVWGNENKDVLDSILKNAGFKNVL